MPKPKPLFGNAQQTNETRRPQTIDVVVPRVHVDPPSPVVTHKSGELIPVSVTEMKAAGVKNPKTLRYMEELRDPMNVLSYGQDTIRSITSNSDNVMRRLGIDDSEEIGKTISSIIAMAKQIKLPDDKEKGGLGGFLHNMVATFSSAKESVLAQFTKMETKIDGLMGEIAKTRDKATQSVTEMKSLYATNRSEIDALGELIAVAEEVFHNQQKEIERLAALAKTPKDAEDLSALMGNQDRLSKRIDSLKKAEIIAIQTAPNIRWIENTSYTIIEKMNALENETIPSWKKMIVQYEVSQRNKKALAFGNAIDDATNKFLTTNSDMVKQNVLDAEKNSQRGSIDMATIEHINANLLSTFEEVMNMRQQGEVERQENSRKMEDMKQLYSSIGNRKKG